MANGINQHAEWLSLIEVSGPFLAEPVLKQAFPQDLDKLNPIKKQRFRQAYEEWQEAIETSDPLQEKLHQEWINWVLTQGLEWDEDDDASSLKAGSVLPENLKLELLEHNLTLKPDFALFGSDEIKPYLLVMNYPTSAVLNDVIAGDGWATSPAERMSQLCRATSTALGLVTNGEQWMLVYAPKDGITSYASWYARLWSQEPVTLNAFYSLLNIATVYNGLGAEAKQLTQLYDDSLQFQDEVTETLGAQVQRAVEVLVQSIDRINNDANGKLLEGVAPTELYEAGLTYMMRLVFMLCAEERGLLLLGDETYEANYAVSTLRMKLREEAGLHGEEVLSYRHNAWSRLLATFRAVYGGIEHETMRMPALGGSLFDPDRFPFLEGRAKGSNWKIEAARPLAIDNRTVLLFLDAIQIFQGRTLSYRALDVEQIGYVYEGLLERTVIRSPDVTLELKATKNAKKPWLLLGELASAELDGKAVVTKLLKDRTGSSASRVKNDLEKEASEAESERLLVACQNDSALRDRIKPYFHFLRADAWGNALIYLKDAYMVAAGDDRRETGTHYTPKSLTEAIVLETLEPVVYIGPSLGTPRQAWQLKTPEELLDLKICDPAMGSGAFLVQVCRYLSERLCEAWLQAEEAGSVIILEERVADSKSTIDPLPNDAEERLLVARRLIAEHCLYGVDVNPLAVELAKLAVWLVTLSKGRPFGFLDHNLKAGNSLLGIHDLNQLYYLNMKPQGIEAGGGTGKQLFAQNIETAVNNALALRKEIRDRPVRDIRDVEVITHLNGKALAYSKIPELIADALIGEALVAADKPAKLAESLSQLSVAAAEVMEDHSNEIALLEAKTKKLLAKDVEGGHPRKPLHWPLAFPEVFDSETGGFNAIVSNVPFLGAKRISGAMGLAFREYLASFLVKGKNAQGDLAAYFFLQLYGLLGKDGCFGLLATNTIAEGDTRQVGLEPLLNSLSATIYRAYPNEAWPGKAAVITSRIHVKKGGWRGEVRLNDSFVDHVSAFLSEREEWSPAPLGTNADQAFQGNNVLGLGFTLSMEEAEGMIKDDSKNDEVVFPYIGGKDLNTHPAQESERWIVNFFDWSEGKAKLFEKPYEHIRKSIYPERLEKSKQKSYAKIMDRWWMHWNNRIGLYHAIGRGASFFHHPSGWVRSQPPLKSVIAAARVSKYFNPLMITNQAIFNEKIVVIASDSNSVLAVLNSSLVAAWIWKHSSRLKMDLNFSPTDAYQTLAFPNVAEDSPLVALGENYSALRREIMLTKKAGLTKLYNRFHDPDDMEYQINEMRRLHQQIDEEVASSYGWNDLDLEHDFHEVDYLPENGRIRYTISEKARGEVLDRLTLLNKERYAEEQQVHEKITPIKSYKKSKARNLELDKVAEPSPQDDLFGLEDE